MADMDADYRRTLELEYSRRQERNPRYSLRAFAQFLNVDVSYLSKLRAGQIILSVDLAADFAQRLEMSNDQRREFILSVADEQKCHALYLVDPSLTDCDPTHEARNQEPRPRTKKRSRSLASY